MFIKSDRQFGQEISILQAQQLTLNTKIQIQKDRILQIDQQLAYITKAHQLILEQQLAKLQEENIRMIEEVKRELLITRDQYCNKLEAVLNSFQEIDQIWSEEINQEIKQKVKEITSNNQQYLGMLSDRLQQQFIMEEQVIKAMKHKYMFKREQKQQQQQVLKVEPFDIDSNNQNQNININIPNKPRKPYNDSFKHQMQSKMKQIQYYKNIIDKLKLKIVSSYSERDYLHLKEHERMIEKSMAQFQELKVKRNQLIR